MMSTSVLVFLKQGPVGHPLRVQTRIPKKVLRVLTHTTKGMCNYVALSLF